MKEAVTSKKTVAVMEIGTSAIRMVIAEMSPKTEIRYIENLQKSIRFGNDVFATGKISSKTMRDGIRIIKNFKDVAESYQVEKLQALATSAVREASNRENFIDQIFVRTGIDVEILEGAEENRLELIAVEHAFQDKIDMGKRNCLIVEVGSGSTELIVLNQGQVEVTRTLSLGAMRLPDRPDGEAADSSMIQRVLKRSIHDIVLNAAREYSFDQVDTFIALGADMRFVASQLVEKIEGRFAMIQKKPFLQLLNRIMKLQPDEIVKEYGVVYTSAETLRISLLIYSHFLQETKVEEVIIPMVSIRDGILLEMAQLFSGYKRTDLSKQVINSAKNLALKYQYDKAHALCVASLGVKLFDALKEDHGLGTRERLLLEVAAILHDIGAYISPASHHKHSSYLVDASDIFGLRKSHKDIVSNIVRYHRRSTPKNSHVTYMSLPKPDRAVISKLAAILRIADALDHSHQQKVRNFTLSRTDQVYTIWVPPETGDITLERHNLIRKSEMFGEVFGVAVVLKQGAPKPVPGAAS